MKLLITFKGNAETITFPINYRPLIHGMIYRMLSVSTEYAEEKHSQASPKDRSYKGFTFSPLSGFYHVEGHQISFAGDISLEIRSIDPMMIALLYHSILSAGKIRIGDETLNVMQCRMEDRHLFTDKIKIHTVAPIVAYSTDTTGYRHFFSPLDEEFYNLIYGNAKRKGAFFHLSAAFDLSLSLLPGTRPLKQLSSFKGTILEGWFGSFLLEGSPEYLDMLYQTGLGSKNTEGFGMFEIINPA